MTYQPSRRQLLLASASMAVLAGCGGSGGGDSRTPQGKFEIPKPVTKLPANGGTFRLVDSNDTKTPFWEQLFEAYQQKHPDIECQYDGLPWAKIEEVVPLGIRNETAHDVIQLPSSIPLDQAVANGWVAPLDDLFPDIQKWKAQYPDLTYADGARVFDGKTYQVQVTTDRRPLAALHYNTQYMQDAGYDPQEKPLTWDEYRDAARKITKAGNGQYYGIVIEGGHPDRLAVYIDHLARSAGATAVGGIDPKTGEFHYERDEIVAAIELLLALKKDGSILPGSNSLQAPEAWPRVLRQNAGMVTAGSWVTVLWQTEDPEFDFGVGASPVAEENALPQGYGPLAGDSLVIYSGSKMKEVAADILHYVTSIEGQTEWAKICGVANPPILTEAIAKTSDQLTKQEKQCTKLADELVVNPDPVIGNPDVSLVTRNEKALSPNWGETIQALLVGELSDVRQALADLKERSERNRDEAIAAAKKEGAKVSRDDWVFSNWDPTKDYGEADYEAR